MELTKQRKQWLEENGYYNLRVIEGRGICGLSNFIYTTALVIGIDDTGYVGRYCYSHPIHALKALVMWEGNGDPEGDWIKYKGTGGERSRIDESPEEEQQSKTA